MSLETPTPATPETAPAPVQDFGVLAIIPVGGARQQFFLYDNLSLAEAALAEAMAIGQFRYRHTDKSMTVIQTGPSTQYLVTLQSVYNRAIQEAQAQAAARQQAQQQQQQAFLPPHLRGAVPKS